MSFRGDRLKSLRTEKRLSRRELGEMCGLSGQTIWLLESGRRRNPEADTLTALTAGLGVNIGIFFGDDPHSNEYDGGPSNNLPAA